jgi:hypothetical protein
MFETFPTWLPRCCSLPFLVKKSKKCKFALSADKLSLHLWQKCTKLWLHQLQMLRTRRHCMLVSAEYLKENMALLLLKHKFCRRAVTNSCESGEPILRRELPHRQKRCLLTDYFKNVRSVGVP